MLTFKLCTVCYSLYTVHHMLQTAHCKLPRLHCVVNGQWYLLSDKNPLGICLIGSTARDCTLYCILQNCTILYSTALHCMHRVTCNTLQCSTLYCTAKHPHCTMYYSELYCIILYCTAHTYYMYYVLPWIVLYFTVLHYTHTILCNTRGGD